MLRRHSPALLLVLASCRSSGGVAPTAPPAPPPLTFRPVTQPVTDEKKQEDEKPKWNVEAPPGARRPVAIDTDEGTWMSVDVSPDGKTVAFDLLGDLYTVPIGGGE